jgi:hypothetical protein
MGFNRFLVLQIGEEWHNVMYFFSQIFLHALKLPSFFAKAFILGVAESCFTKFWSFWKLFPWWFFPVIYEYDLVKFLGIHFTLPITGVVGHTLYLKSKLTLLQKNETKWKSQLKCSEICHNVFHFHICAKLAASGGLLEARTDPPCGYQRGY